MDGLEKLTKRRLLWVSMHLRLMRRNLTSCSVKPNMISSLSLDDILANFSWLELDRKSCSLSVGMSETLGRGREIHF